MCGIAGLICAEGQRVPRGLPKLLSDTFCYRGPDGYGFMSWDGESAKLSREPVEDGRTRISFVHRRLAIIDLSDGGWQPVSSPDGQVSLVFNGEIYNYIELREELRALGCKFTTSSDTEVLLKGYLAWGKDVFPKLIGMFAIALLDLREREVLLVRDQFGIKPIVYVHSKLGLAFASEINGLLQIDGWDRALDPIAIFRYLRWGSSLEGRSTLLKNVERVLPSEILSISIDDPSVTESHKFWDLEIGRGRSWSLSEAAERLRCELEQSVQIHLRSDVPVGIALSGGVDSTSLALISRMVSPETALTAFSYLADSEKINEGPLIGMVASRAGISLESVHLNEANFTEIADRAARRIDEPFGTPSIIAESEVFKRAHELGITVVFSGQGPDEMMAGYARYRPLAVLSQMRMGHLGFAMRQLSASSKWPDSPTKTMLGWIAMLTLPAGLQGTARQASGKNLTPEGIRGEWFKEQGVRISSASDMACGLNLKKRLRHDIFNFGLQNLLAWADQTAMQHSIECRLPYLNPRLAELVMSLPEEYLVAGDGTCKQVLRTAVKGLVPDEILKVKRKIGFQTDTDRLLAGSSSWVRDVVESDWCRALPFVDMPAVRRQVESLAAGRTVEAERLWRLINFSIWSEERGLAV